MTPTLHLLGLPHTVTRSEFSHCAFTGKAQRFSPMMRSVGYHVIHYGNAGAESGANEQVDVLTREEFDRYVSYDPSGSAFVGNIADVGHPLYQEFNARLAVILKQTVKPKDVICLPFGHAHQDALANVHDAYFLETGVGYPTCFAPFRVFESNAWYHWHCGREDRSGSDYHWVIPNYYNITEWTPQYEAGGYLLYFGRICDVKGMAVVIEIAKHRPDLTVILCGQGDPTPYLVAPNIGYEPPLHGRARSDLLGNALAVLMPTRYIEPFGGVTIEANLCGTPVLGSSFGSFTETIQHGITGYRCRTLGDWLAAIEHVEQWGSRERKHIARVTRQHYNMFALAHQYDMVIRQLTDLAGAGWYTLRSPLGPVQKALPTGPVSVSG
jgi:glycosyltransferase involved in cell wall biosynthesis